jgi:2',3'-cyclic-nucleotide 2'-phosphodiesterase (5'-nucleotidase family)
LNVARFDALTIGNHEFDNGDKNLAEFVALVNGTTFLSANRKFVSFSASPFKMCLSNSLSAPSS